MTLKSAPATPLDGTAVEHVMHVGFIGCPFETPLVAVARLMAEHQVHAVVGFGDATEGDTCLWGLVSDTDIVAALAAGEDASTVGEIAASEVVTVVPDDTARHAVELMHDHQVTHLLVVDPSLDRPLGVVSTLDVAGLVGGVTRAPLRTGSRVENLMTTPAISVPPTMPLKEIAALLLNRGISGVPVVEDGEVVGVVSEADVVRVEGAHAMQPGRRLGRSESKETTTPATAGDVMTTPAVTSAPWRSAASAAALMTEKGVKRLPVIRNGELVGIVTRSDLVRAFARNDEAIAREIREEILRRSFWIEPEDVTVVVERGDVTLTGEVPSELEVETLPRAVARVPGVIAVRSELQAGVQARRTYRRLAAGWSSCV